MEEFRLQYPLTEDSLVLDVGAFRGDFVSWCRQRWRCRVVAFEPCGEFADALEKRFADDFHVRVLRYGLSGRTEEVAMSRQGDASSAHTKAAAGSKLVLLRDAGEVLPDYAALAGSKNIDLMKINIEGGEYALLDRMIETGLVAYVRFLQIQFHDFGASDPAAARDRIRARIEATHREQWCVNGGQWESWEQEQVRVADALGPCTALVADAVDPSTPLAADAADPSTAPAADAADPSTPLEPSALVAGAEESG